MRTLQVSDQEYEVLKSILNRLNEQNEDLNPLLQFKDWLLADDKKRAQLNQPSLCFKVKDLYALFNVVGAYRKRDFREVLTKEGFIFNAQVKRGGHNYGFLVFHSLQQMQTIEVATLEIIQAYQAQNTIMG